MRVLGFERTDARLPKKEDQIGVVVDGKSAPGAEDECGEEEGDKKRDGDPAAPGPGRRRRRGTLRLVENVSRLVLRNHQVKRSRRTHRARNGTADWGNL